MRTLLLTVCFVSVCGCAEQINPVVDMPDQFADGGWTTDATVEEDAGAADAPDAGADAGSVEEDAGTPDAGVDAGVEEDAGRSIDAGATTDAGRPRECEPGMRQWCGAPGGLMRECQADGFWGVCADPTPPDGGPVPDAGTPDLGVGGDAGECGQLGGSPCRCVEMVGAPCYGPPGWDCLSPSSGVQLCCADTVTRIGAGLYVCST